MSDDPQHAQFEAAMEQNRQLRAKRRALREERHAIRDRLRTLTLENAVLCDQTDRRMDQLQDKAKQAPSRERKKIT